MLESSRHIVDYQDGLDVQTQISASSVSVRSATIFGIVSSCASKRHAGGVSRKHQSIIREHIMRELPLDEIEKMSGGMSLSSGMQVIGAIGTVAGVIGAPAGAAFAAGVLLAYAIVEA